MKRHCAVLGFLLLTSCLPAMAQGTIELVKSQNGSQVKASRESLFVVCDARKPIDSPGSPNQAAEWTRGCLAQISDEEILDLDTFIYLHGWQAEPSAAISLSREVHGLIADVGARPSQKKSPLFIHFAWPAYSSAFSDAQQAATSTARYLHAILVELRLSRSARRIFVLAHSLGAHVAMEALNFAKMSGAREPLLDGLALVQGAIPAVSIRSWKSVIKIRFPSDEIEQLRRGNIAPSRPITADYSSGIGRYSESIRLAKRLAYTTALRDVALHTWFALDELHIPSDLSRPNTMPVPGRILAGPEPRALAVGTPFPANPVPDVWKPQLHPETRGRNNDWHDRMSRRVDPRPRDIMWSTVVEYEFKVDHPSTQVMELEKLPVLPEDWHSPFATRESREHLLAAILRYFEY